MSKSSLNKWSYCLWKHIQSTFYRLVRICYCGKEFAGFGRECQITLSGGKVPGGKQVLVWPIGQKCWDQVTQMEHELTPEQKEAMQFETLYVEDDDE